MFRSTTMAVRAVTLTMALAGCVDSVESESVASTSGSTPSTIATPGTTEPPAPVTPTATLDETVGTDVAELWRTEACSLQYAASNSAIVEASISIDPPPVIVDEFAAPLRLDIERVLWAGRETVLGDTVVGSAYFDPDGPPTLDGTFYEEMWPELKPGRVQLVRLRPDPYALTEFEIAGLIGDSGFVSMLPDEPGCRFVEHFNEFASRVDMPANLETFVALTAAQYEYSRCDAEPPGCPLPPEGRELVEAAVLASAEVPPEAAEPDAAWTAASAESRSLAFNVIPDEVVSSVMLIGVHVEFVGAAPNALFSLRCELGVGYLWGRDGLDTLFPVPTCRNSPLILTAEFEGTIQHVGSVAVDQLDEQNGTWITVDFSTTPATMTSRRLVPGEAEMLTGMDTATLELLRDQHSDTGG